MAARRRRRDYQKLPSRLQHYGKTFGDWFIDSESKLYSSQKNALKSLEKWFSDEDTKDYTAVVVMPTGSGKTGVICCLPYFIGRAIHKGKISSADIDISKPVLIIAPGIDILNQLKDNLVLNENSAREPFLMEMGFLSVEKDKEAYYTVFTVKNVADVNDLDTEARGSDIVLSNSQKWRKKKNGTPMYADLPDDFFSMVIVDEAHHLPAKQWEEIVKKFKPHAKVVFFTATPYRADKKEITTDGAISAKGFAYCLTREKAIQSKMIRDVQMRVLDEEGGETIYPLQDVDVGPPPAKRGKIAKDTPSDIIGRIEHAQEVLTRVKSCIEEKNSTCPLPGNAKHAAIVITKDTVEATFVRFICTEILNIPQQKIGMIHSQTDEMKASKKKRKEITENIRNHKYEIVIIVKMLLEGFDYKPFGVAGIVTTIRSPVKFAQFIGRIQRIVRHRGEDGKEGVEDGIKGDIITHQYFRQEQLFEEYQQPLITEEENEEIDEDTDDDNSQSENEY